MQPYRLSATASARCGVVSPTAEDIDGLGAAVEGPEQSKIDRQADRRAAFVNGILVERSDEDAA
jgi:hypothetical protein